ncbi:MAG: hypothetical protein Kow00114_33570 [Kiloniellaceae bacterium]
MTAEPQDTNSRPSRLKQLRKKLADGLSKRWYYAKRFTASCKQPAIEIFVVGLVVVLLHIVFRMAADVATLVSWIKWTGLALQIGGLLIVIWGMRKSLQIFGRPLPEVRLFHWLEGLWHVVMPPKPQNFVLSPVNLESRSEISQVRITVQGGSVEQRLKNLESDVDAAWDRIEKLETKIAVNERVARDDLAKEQKKRQDADKVLERKLESALIGDSHLEASGVMLVFVGIVLTTIPEELASISQQTGLYSF